MINVLVVDDSAFMRKMISDILEKDSRIKVVDRARNGEDALKKIKLHNPDVITLDVEMPIMDGLEALQIIMREYPKPVIMVSSTTKEGAATTIRAMEYGAFDFIEKPSGSISLDIYKVQTDLIDKVIYGAKVSITKLSTNHQKDPCKEAPIISEVSNSFPVSYPFINSKKLSSKGIIAIGTSTGGPKALQRILSELPEDFPHPILIVQHMPIGFTKSLSERLNTLSKISVKEAENGEFVQRGVAYIAPGGYHLKVRRLGTALVIVLDQSEQINNHRPSVDALFLSLSELPKQDVMAIILTGMGSDGKNGLLQLKKTTPTIAVAESNESAIVYGMPRAAIETNKVDIIVNIEQVASTIVRHCK
ncbi:two-component system chemotaxis response regulator CheB [Evansella vedderi]|uniref:Protein-glutamate methylesterase/protein-glutamine glutaminase n=1 Tax=Evansella vedderi TaxID=38282 RepID=A0ABT9ZR35_9BACI|nr:chemotaxis response regulator protein-glutamate methylesterase [Evansella vedderi]MDQ0253693.1 two-component system chemotaxis response regulator CheB [Evansella vedderi]